MKTLLFLALVGIAVFFSACYPREIVHTQRSIERELPDTRFRRQVAMSFGPATMGAARWITGKVDDTDTQRASAYLQNVDRIQFGVYETDNLPEFDQIDLPKRLQKKLENDEWELAAAYREDDTRGWILYRDDGQIVEDMFAIVFADDELILARVQGNLNDLMTEVVKDHHIIPDMLP